MWIRLFLKLNWKSRLGFTFRKLCLSLTYIFQYYVLCMGYMKSYLHNKGILLSSTYKMFWSNFVALGSTILINLNVLMFITIIFTTLWYLSLNATALISYMIKFEALIILNNILDLFYINSNKFRSNKRWDNHLSRNKNIFPFTIDKFFNFFFHSGMLF